VPLEEDRIYEKIVIGGRGGFCYELNGLFRWLLRSLGFAVSMVSARVYMPTKERFTPEFIIWLGVFMDIWSLLGEVLMLLGTAFIMACGLAGKQPDIPADSTD
jgi:arylamine N-acetyltransferase